MGGRVEWGWNREEEGGREAGRARVQKEHPGEEDAVQYVKSLG